MANTPASGNGPFEFTDSQDRQVSIPLTAFAFDSNSKLVVDPSWQTVTQAQPAAGLLAYALAAGLIAPAASPAPFPAMIVKAADPGAVGNNLSGGANIAIAVTISNIVPASDPTQTTFSISVTETDIYTGLTCGSIESVLGSSAVSGSAPGLVRVAHNSVDPTGAPLEASGALAGSPARFDVHGSGSPSLVFTLAAKKSGADGTLTHIQVTPNTSSPPPAVETFTLQASWTKTANAVTLATLVAAAQNQLGYEITLALPGGGAFSVPAAATTALSGGGAGSAASATLFTGI